MNATYPQTDSVESREGTAWHWLWAKMLYENSDIPDTAPNGEVITEEMLEAAGMFLDVVSDRVFTNGGFGALHVEERVSIDRVSFKNWGTPDLWAYSTTKKVLEVIDGKYGHKYVDHFENWQCLDYAIGILDEITGGNAIYASDIVINITIVQPRCYYGGKPVRTWTLTGGELRAYCNILENAANLALVDNPVAKTNSECCYCPGRHACLALQKASYSDAEFSTVSTPLELSPQAAGLELRMLERSAERLEARITGLREVVMRELQSGKSVPLWGLEQTFGREKWLKADQEIIAMGDLMKVDLRKVNVVTPKQAVKLGMPPDVVNGFKFVPKGQVKLIKVNTNDAMRVFKMEQ